MQTASLTVDVACSQAFLCTSRAWWPWLGSAAELRASLKSLQPAILPVLCSITPHPPPRASDRRTAVIEGKFVLWQIHTAFCGKFGMLVCPSSEAGNYCSVVKLAARIGVHIFALYSGNTCRENIVCLTIQQRQTDWDVCITGDDWQQMSIFMLGKTEF